MASQQFEELVLVSDNMDGDEAERNEDPVVIAMSNALILANLFEYCDFETLGQCRRVCQQWFKESLPTWLNKGPTQNLTLKPGAEPNSHRHPSKRVGVDTTMSAFIGLVHNEFHSYGSYEYVGLRQYKKFFVAGDATGLVENHYLQHFLRIYGESITELKLFLSIPDFDTFRALMLSASTPNLVKLSVNLNLLEDVLRRGTYGLMEGSHKKLTSLKIYCYDYHSNSDSRRQENLSVLPLAGWLQLLSRYPNLKTLFLGGFGIVEGKAGDRILEAIGKIRQSDKKSLDLRNLHMLRGITGRPSLPPLFRNAGLRLETLELRMYDRDNPPSPQIFCEVLNSQAATLRKLMLQWKSPVVGFEEPLQQMPFLQSIELHGWTFQDLSPLKNFPNLKSIFLADGPDGGIGDVFPKMLRGTGEAALAMPPTVTKLHCRYSCRIAPTDPLRPDDVSKMAQLFPNLKDVGLWLNNDSFAVVLQSWPGLQHLTIIGKGVDDDGIAGAVPNFPRMQDLESLCLSHFDDDYVDDVGPTALTEKSLIRFLELPILQSLQVTLDSQLNVDCELLRKLGERLTTFKLTRAKSWDVASLADVDDGDDDDDWDEDENDGGNNGSDGTSYSDTDNEMQD